MFCYDRFPSCPSHCAASRAVLPRLPSTESEAALQTVTVEASAGMLRPRVWPSLCGGRYRLMLSAFWERRLDGDPVFVDGPYQSLIEDSSPRAWAMCY